MSAADRFPTPAAPCALALTCAAFALIPAQAAELRPYSLPSQQQQQQMVRPVEPLPQAPAQAQTQAIPSQYFYQDYARWADTLQPAQRAELALGFERDAKRALDAGRIDEAQHYLRLVSILRARP
jgi:hypothetical protein